MAPQSHKTSHDLLFQLTRCPRVCFKSFIVTALVRALSLLVGGYIMRGRKKAIGDRYWSLRLPTRCLATSLPNNQLTWLNEAWNRYIWTLAY